jgi:O-antigen/teichoic acid export membrane protein
MAKVIRNSINYAIIDLLPKFGQFIFLPIYLKYLAPSDFGTISSINTLMALLGLLFTFAIDRSIVRLFYDFKDDESRKEFLGTIFIFFTTLTLVISLIFYSFPKILSSIFNNIEFYPLIAYALLTKILANFSLVPIATLTAKHNSKSQLYLGFATFIFVNIFSLINVAILKLGVDGYLKGMIFGNLVMLFFYLPYVWKIVKFKFNTEYLRKAFQFSLPILPSMILSWFIGQSDKIFIERFSNLQEVGLYSLAYNFSAIAAFIPIGFYKSYNPFFYDIASSEPKDQAIKTLRPFNTLYLLIISLTSFSVFCVFDLVIDVFFDDRYLETIKIIPLILISAILSNSSGVYNLSIYFEKKSKVITYVYLISAIINMILNFALIPYFGMYGASIATIITLVVVFILQSVQSPKYFYVGFDKGVIFSVWFYISLVVSFFYLTEFNLKLTVSLKFLFLLILVIILYLKMGNKVIVEMKQIRNRK